ncbi:MAG: helix-turn-helix domain-containing protein [Haloechinothrix sp.]
MNVEKQQLEFGESLRRLRASAGYPTGKDFAQAIGWQASKVSRIENGRTLPTLADVEAWVGAVGASPEIAVSMRDDMHGIRIARDRWKRHLRHGHAGRQRIEADTERRAVRITAVEFFLVPGLVQTADYARAVLTIAAERFDTPRDTDEAVRERIRRQDVLYDSDKRIEIIVAETALRYPICSAPVMRAQLDRLTTLCGLPHVRFGVLPLDTVLPTITMHGYASFDDAVAVEVNHTEIAVTDPDDVALYERITERLWSVAAEGVDARAILARLLA